MNKRLIILFSCLVVAVLLIVVSCVAFTITKITIETTSGFNLTDEEKEQIIVDSKIVRFSSIFSLDEDIAISNVESLHPTIKVVTIERKFPNIVCLNISNRTPILSIELNNESYALVDRELKVVKIEDEIDDNYISNIVGFKLDAVQIGSFIKLEWLTRILNSAESLSFINARFSTYITEINYVQAEDSNAKVYLKTNTGVIIELEDNASIGQTFNVAYTYYGTLSEANKSNGFIKFENDICCWVGIL